MPRPKGLTSSIAKHLLKLPGIDRLSARQQEEIRSAFQPIVDYLRKIRDRD